MMIQCQHVQKYYGAELVLGSVTFEIKSGETVGLIGRNGTGKTTLMRLLAGSEPPDQGQIHIRRNVRIGTLAQIPDYRREDTVYDVLLGAYDDLRQVQAEMKRLEAEMSRMSLAAGEDNGITAAQSGGAFGSAPLTLDELLRQYGVLQEAFERGGGYEMEASILRIALGLGITEEHFGRGFASLSGGEKTKVGLAVMLLRNPDLLLLDEPTNHLDMAATEWLEGFVRSFPGTTVVISHDRFFLDAVTEKIVELEDGEAFTYFGNYSAYKEEKEQRLLQQFADYQEQQKKIKKMQESIKQLIEWGNRSNPPNAGFHRRAASMQKALDRMTKLKRPILERQRIDLQLQQGDRSGKDAIILREVGACRGGRWLYRELTHTLRYGEAAVLIGANGTGKSTLLKNILGTEPPQEGQVQLGSRVEPGYLAQQAAPAGHEETVLEFFRDHIGIETGEARGQLARFLFYGADVFKKVSRLSGGEWTRLRLAVLMHQKPNLLMLDEPTNHLDIDAREALEEALEEYTGTLLAVSHDRYFINKVASQVWALEGGRLGVTPGGYDDFRAELARKEAARAGGEPARKSGRPTGPAEQAAWAGGASDAGAVPDGRSKPAAAAPGTPSPVTRATGGEAQGGRAGSGARPPANPASVRKLEADIAAAEAELAAAEAAMQAPAVACDAVRLAELLELRNAQQLRVDALLTQYVALLDD
ncbi:ribosomal protection-like ABC-F family protein [Paenibacillus sanguinis]|uniref:ribosomal protection-like ABC-F family protein n=1 Tax=Paenibacillus sanguinis TaxID=225906 RepID=UPI000360B9DF|nr:ABC-F family ATP-binding cassette domain-containing protein [Paenibacillus sanguinis]